MLMQELRSCFFALQLNWKKNFRLHICLVVFKKDGLAVRDEIAYFVSIACLSGGKKKRLSCPRWNRLFCSWLSRKIRRRRRRRISSSTKKLKVSKLQCSIKNECSIRAFEASTFQSAPHITHEFAHVLRLTKKRGGAQEKNKDRQFNRK